MEDWLGELDPQAQRVLRQAQEAVTRRGGYAISVEDVLLSLLELSPSFASFLSQHGIDLDELFRTIQCEQPIVALSSEYDGLSAQVVYWLATALETGESPMTVSHLLATLTNHCERLSQRAYVAVLEQVPPQAWGHLNTGSDVFQHQTVHGIRSIKQDAAIGLSASKSAQEAARKLLCMVMSMPVPVLELQAPSVIQCRSLVQRLMLELEACLGTQVHGVSISGESLAETGPVSLVKRIETQVHSTDGLSVLLFEGITPDVLAALIRRDGVLSWRRLLDAEALIPILAYQPAPVEAATRHWLAAQFDRTFRSMAAPAPRALDVLGYLQRARPALEAELGMQVDGDALALAACYSHQPSVVCSGARQQPDSFMLNEPADLDRAWSILHSAAAMTRAESACGPSTLGALRAQWQQSRQQELVALARADEPAGILSEEQLSVDLAAEEISWLECVEDNSTSLRAAQVVQWLELEAGDSPRICLPESGEEFPQRA